MPNKLDPYREALVVETKTLWPADLPNAPRDESTRRHIEQRLHAAPADAAELDYLRLPVGFVRKITVTSSDLERLGNVS